MLEYESELPDEVTGGRVLDKASATRLLKRIIAQCESRHVLFDLDSTLLDNRPRSVRIMREFAAHVGESVLADAREIHFTDWSAANAMANIGLQQDSINRLLGPHEAFWFERFFSSSYCEIDEAIPGAACFVNAVHQRGAMVSYLTGRNETMRDGTLACLARLGFPNPGSGSVELIMKPVRDYSDDAFKQEKLQSLQIADKLVAAFDNEPTHINTYRQLFSKAECIHLATDHSMRPVRLLDGIHSIADFTFA